MFLNLKLIESLELVFVGFSWLLLIDLILSISNNFGEFETYAILRALRVKDVDHCNNVNWNESEVSLLQSKT